MNHLYELMNYHNYTIEDKIMVYKRMLKYLIADQKIETYYGLCYYMIKSEHEVKAMQSVNLKRKKFHFYHTLEESPFPELLILAPKHFVNSFGKPGGVYWFPLNSEGANCRVEILENILKQLSSNL